MPILIETGAAFLSIPVTLSDSDRTDSMISPCYDDVTRHVEISTKYSILVGRNE